MHFVSETEHDGHFNFNGEWTIYHAADIHEELMSLTRGNAGDLILNCSEISEIDSSGLQLFVAISQSCISNHVSCCFTNLSGCVLEKMKILGVFGRIPME